MKDIGGDLKIEVSLEARRIEAFISSSINKSSKDGALIGLSGGLDSAVAAYLTVRAVGADSVHFLNLTEADSNTTHQHDAHFIAEDLGIPLQHQDMTPILQEMGSYRLLPIGRLPTRGLRAGLVRLGRRLLGLTNPREILMTRLQPSGNTYIARANAYSMAKHRLRMLLLYQHAEINNWMVIGAANRTEWLTGTFTKWGCDHCADLMPLLHLYRTQVEQLAEYLAIPERIRVKPADPDILPGINDKEKLLGSFVETDSILRGFESGTNYDELVDIFGLQAVSRLSKLRKMSKLMRNAPLYLDPN